MVDDGDIFLCPNFVLSDGCVHNTLFLIISGGTPFTPLLCIKATTKLERYRPLEEGCNNSDKHFYKSFFIPSDWDECFKDDTCLDLRQLYVIPFNDFIHYREKNGLKQLGKMSSYCFDSVLECLSTQIDDIAEDLMERIIDARTKIVFDF